MKKRVAIVGIYHEFNIILPRKTEMILDTLAGKIRPVQLSLSQLTTFGINPALYDALMAKDAHALLAGPGMSDHCSGRYPRRHPGGCHYPTL